MNIYNTYINNNVYLIKNKQIYNIIQSTLLYVYLKVIFNWYLLVKHVFDKL